MKNIDTSSLPTLNEKLISGDQDDSTPTKPTTLLTESSQEIEIEYVETADQPQVNLTGLPLIAIPALLIAAKLFVAEKAGIPILEYLFVSLLIAFIGNYYLIRKHNLYPYLPNEKYDHQLKVCSILGFIIIILTSIWGWNNSGAIVVALVWELMRGNRVGVLIYGFLAAIIGSLLLEDNYSWMKLLEFIPGILLGYITSTIYTLRLSSTYTILHEFLLIVTVFLPVCFPMQHIVKPSLLQWGVMIAGGIVAMPTGYFLVKMMQNQRVSITMTVFCSILILLTTQYLAAIDYIGAVLVIGGVGWIVHRVYISTEPEVVMV